MKAVSARFLGLTALVLNCGLLRRLSCLFRRAIVDGVTSRTAIRVGPALVLSHRRKMSCRANPWFPRNDDVCE